MNIDYSYGQYLKGGFLAGLLILLLAVTVSAADLLVTVNGDSIKTTDLDREIMKVHRSLDEKAREDYDYRRLLTKLINDRLLIQEARALDFQDEDWLLDELHDYKVKTAINYYIADNFKPDLTIDDSEIVQSFDKNYSKSQIRIISVPNLATAETVKKELDAGADMDSLAREVSIDMYRFRGGLQNVKFWSDIEASIRLPLMNMKVGQISEPFKYRDAYAVIKSEYSAAADTAELDQYRDGIIITLQNIKKKETWNRFMDSLEAKYPIKIDSLKLQTILSDTASMQRAEFLEGTDDAALFLDSNNYVTVNQLRSKISHASMTISKKTVLEVIQTAVKESREDMLLKAAVEHEGYLDSPNVIERYDHAMDSLLVQVYLQEMIKPQIVFNRAEFEDYYDKHKEEFKSPNQYRLHWVMLSNKDIADQMARRLHDGANFDFLLKQYDNDSALVDTKKEWIGIETLPPDIAAQIEKLKIGQSTDAFKTTEGFVIFNLLEIKEGTVKSIDDVDMQLREIMYNKKFREILDANLEALKKASEIKYYDKAIENYFNS